MGFSFTRRALFPGTLATPFAGLLKCVSASEPKYFRRDSSVEAAPDGLSLVPCLDYHPTVADEIDKLAFNIAMGRNWAGIHYRSDAEAGLRLGEDVAISILQDLVTYYTEDCKGFSFRRLNGREVHITSKGEVIEA